MAEPTTRKQGAADAQGRFRAGQGDEARRRSGAPSPAGDAGEAPAAPAPTPEAIDVQGPEAPAIASIRRSCPEQEIL